MGVTKVRRRRRFYKIDPTLNVSKDIKALIFKRKEGFFVDVDEDIFIKDIEKYKLMFVDFHYDETKYNDKSC